MSVATITATALSRTGTIDLQGTAVAVTVSGAADIFVNTGSQFVYIVNGNGATCTVTLQANGTNAIDGQVIANRTVAILTGKQALFGPFPTGPYNDATGNVTISYSVTSSVKILVFTISPNT